MPICFYYPKYHPHQRNQRHGCKQFRSAHHIRNQTPVTQRSAAIINQRRKCTNSQICRHVLPSVQYSICCASRYKKKYRRKQLHREKRNTAHHANRFLSIVYSQRTVIGYPNTAASQKTAQLTHTHIHWHGKCSAYMHLRQAKQPAAHIRSRSNSRCTEQHHERQQRFRNTVLIQPQNSCN